MPFHNQLTLFRVDYEEIDFVVSLVGDAGLLR